VPVKVHRARQPFDEGNRLLVQPKLAGTHDGDGAFWRDFDWQRSASEGMKLVGLPYSGLKVLVIPVIVSSGLLRMFYRYPQRRASIPCR
jgi:hypothetical protein